MLSLSDFRVIEPDPDDDAGFAFGGGGGGGGVDEDDPDDGPTVAPNLLQHQINTSSWINSHSYLKDVS